MDKLEFSECGNLEIEYIFLSILLILMAIYENCSRYHQITIFKAQTLRYRIILISS